jgi:hypothetical protein
VRLALTQRRLADLVDGAAARRRPNRWAAAIGLASALAAACHRPEPAGVDVRWTLRPEKPSVGPATLTVTIGEPPDATGGAEVRVVGHMTHPGMTPVVAATTRRGPGVYDATVDLNMAGDWVLLVTVRLADGRRVERRVDVPGVQ